MENVAPFKNKENMKFACVTDSSIESVGGFKSFKLKLETDTKCRAYE